MEDLIIDCFAGGGGASVGIVKANCLYLKVGERKATPMIYMQNNGQIAFG